MNPNSDSPSYIRTYNPSLPLAERIAQQEEAVRVVAVLSLATKCANPIIQKFVGTQGTTFVFKDLGRTEYLRVLFRLAHTTDSNTAATHIPAAVVYNCYHNFFTYNGYSAKYSAFEQYYNFEAPEQFEEEDSLFQLSCTNSNDDLIRRATMAYAREYTLNSGTYWLEYAELFIQQYPEIWKELEDTYWNTK